MDEMNEPPDLRKLLESVAKFLKSYKAIGAAHGGCPWCGFTKQRCELVEIIEDVDAALAAPALAPAWTTAAPTVPADALPPIFQKRVNYWLNVNRLKPEEVRWGLFPLGFVVTQDEMGELYLVPPGPTEATS
jgi:hypothetical protein